MKIKSVAEMFKQDLKSMTKKAKSNKEKDLLLDVCVTLSPELGISEKHIHSIFKDNESLSDIIPIMSGYAECFNNVCVFGEPVKVQSLMSLSSPTAFYDSNLFVKFADCLDAGISSPYIFFKIEYCKYTDIGILCINTGEYTPGISRILIPSNIGVDSLQVLSVFAFKQEILKEGEML